MIYAFSTTASCPACMSHKEKIVLRLAWTFNVQKLTKKCKKKQESYECMVIILNVDNSHPKMVNIGN